MLNTDVSGWPRHRLRLAFYDFSVRGEGDAATVTAVIGAWKAMGALSEEAAGLWLDALEWRRLGGLLPGWTVPAGAPGTLQPPGEADYQAFTEWRSARLERASAA